MPVPDSESGLAIAPKIFDSWQISKCKASESQPNQKLKPKKSTQKLKIFTAAVMRNQTISNVANNIDA
ncbi:hypothetical protein D0A34_07230 [Microcoleus vaginatus PCC 9802]|nr:hypothetical protein D0A34_07230 [Microcoleus vaginatus PCC 9802]